MHPALSFQGLSATAHVHLCAYLAITDQHTPSFHNLPEIPCTPCPHSPDLLSSHQTKHFLPWPAHHLHRAPKDLHYPTCGTWDSFLLLLKAPPVLGYHNTWDCLGFANVSGAVMGHYTIRAHHLVVAISVLTAVVTQGPPVCLISSLTSLTCL